MEKEDLLLVKGMQFWAKHGYFPEENTLGQRFVVDVEVSIDMSHTCTTDDLTGSLSYMDVYAIAERVATKEQYRTVQRIAQRIADEIIAAYPIKQVRVTVKKPSVAIGGIVEYSGCSIVREPQKN
ncbi:Dihydroneopterin aldolase [Neomoorella glycerini]|uniref:7,8-dihydroneopterin aldolase n=1 Tax=Neomoorella glycerini TaxID=55779 RepID=A0A6I5ZNA9_9FIRM|nr:dihydroneopterin aldolase [Moorella glycerini]QGP91099.1 Dihydroneopterin aldolase [Moorella glycerini]